MRPLTRGHIPHPYFGQRGFHASNIEVDKACNLIFMIFLKCIVYWLQGQDLNKRRRQQRSQSRSVSSLICLCCQVIGTIDNTTQWTIHCILGTKYE